MLRYILFLTLTLGAFFGGVFPLAAQGTLRPTIIQQDTLPEKIELFPAITAFGENQVAVLDWRQGKIWTQRLGQKSRILLSADTLDPARIASKMSFDPKLTEREIKHLKTISKYRFSIKGIWANGAFLYGFAFIPSEYYKDTVRGLGGRLLVFHRSPQGVMEYRLLAQEFTNRYALYQDPLAIGQQGYICLRREQKDEHSKQFYQVEWGAKQLLIKPVTTWSSPFICPYFREGDPGNFNRYRTTGGRYLYSAFSGRYGRLEDKAPQSWLSLDCQRDSLKIVTRSYPRLFGLFEKTQAKQKPQLLALFKDGNQYYLQNQKGTKYILDIPSEYLGYTWAEVGDYLVCLSGGRYLTWFRRSEFLNVPPEANKK